MSKTKLARTRHYKKWLLTPRGRAYQIKHLEKWYLKEKNVKEKIRAWALLVEHKRKSVRLAHTAIKRPKNPAPTPHIKKISSKKLNNHIKRR